MSSNLVFLLLIIACGLALVLIILTSRRIQKEGLTLDDKPREHFKRSIEDVQRQQREDQAVMQMADDSQGAITHNKYGYSKKVSMSVDQALRKASMLLGAEEFQLLANTNVSEKLNKDDMTDCHMLTIYHRELAGRVIDLEPALGMMICRITFRHDLTDVVYVQISDPLLLLGNSATGELHEAVSAIKMKLLKVLQRI